MHQVPIQQCSHSGNHWSSTPCTLRFNILDAVYNPFPLITELDFCFNVQLFGCLIFQANHSKIKCEHTHKGTKATAITPSTTYHKSKAFLTVHKQSLPTSNHPLQSPSPVQSCCSSSSPAITTLSPTVAITLVSTNEPTNLSHLWVIVSVAVLLLAVMLLVVGMVAGVLVWSAVRRKKMEINDHDYFIIESNTTRYVAWWWWWIHSYKCTHRSVLVL